MPSSHFHQINEIVELIVNCNPQSVLDIGVGFGKYGFLCREYLELWDGRYEYNNWKRQIDGIEVFSDYLKPFHNLIYNKIYQGNAIDILPTLKTKYDLILLIDILEHFEKKEGDNILYQCLKHARNIIISTPKNIGKQKDSFGNIYETHKFQWKKNHFDKFGGKFFITNDISIICFIGEDELTVRKKLKSNLPSKSSYSRTFNKFKRIVKN